MTDFTPVASLIGGGTIGLASALLLLTLGRVAGVSGIFGGLLSRGGERKHWQAAFVLGLVLGGALVATVEPSRFVFALDRSLPTLAAAGLLVGFGTRMGNGCTSGHGVCGIGRGSRRSFVATLTFISTAVVTVFIVDHLVGGAP